MIIVADTSALFAGFDADQPEQSRIAAIMETETLAVSPLVLTELDHLVHRDLGFSAATQVIDALAGRMTDAQYRLAELKVAESLRPKASEPNTMRCISTWPIRSGLCSPTATEPTAFLRSTNETSARSNRSPPVFMPFVFCRLTFETPAKTLIMRHRGAASDDSSV